jgi:hypothetical protein
MSSAGGDTGGPAEPSVVGPSTDALPSAPPAPQPAPTHLSASFIPSFAPPGYQSRDALGNSQSVDWASLPPPPGYTSRAALPTLGVGAVPSYRTLDTGYTRAAPPRYQPAEGSVINEEPTRRPSGSTPGPGPGPGPGTSPLPSPGARRRSSAVNRNQGDEGTTTSTRWCLFFLLLAMGFFTFGASMI